MTEVLGRDVRLHRGMIDDVTNVDPRLQQLLDNAHTIPAATEVADMRAAVEGLVDALGDWQAGLDRDDSARHLPWHLRSGSVKRRADGRWRPHCLVCWTAEIREELVLLEDGEVTRIIHVGLRACDIPVPATSEIESWTVRIRHLAIRHQWTPTGRPHGPAHPLWGLGRSKRTR